MTTSEKTGDKPGGGGIALIMGGGPSISASCATVRLDD
ncbi:MAG: hypothetical protein ACJA09_003623 [Alcanivorax sp.]|jgi:hypothetical protein